MFSGINYNHKIREIKISWNDLVFKRIFARKKTVKTEIDIVLVRWCDCETDILSDLKILTLDAPETCMCEFASYAVEYVVK